MNKLDKQGQALLSVLADHLKTVIPGDPTTYLGYKEIHDTLNLPLKGATWGRSLQIQGLNSLAEWTKNENKPAVTGIIISTMDYEPGAGYFKLFNQSDGNYVWWEEQVRLSKEYDWSTYLHD